MSKAVCRAVRLTALAIVLAGRVTPGQAIPINSDVALTVSERQWMLRTGYRAIEGSGRLALGMADLDAFVIPTALVF